MNETSAIETRRYRRHACGLVVGVGAALILTATINWLIDPFATFGAPLFQGFNARKPLLTRNIRWARAVQIQTQKPRCMWFGSSRSEYGLDEDHPGWDEPARNGALSGGNMYETMRYFQHAAGQGRLQQAVVGMDFFAFNANIKPRIQEVDPLLAVSPDGRPRGRWAVFKLRYANLLSTDLLNYSRRTVQRQKRESRYHADMRVNAQAFQSRVSGDTQRAGFRLITKSFLGHIYFPEGPGSYAFVSDKTRRNSLEEFRTIVRTAYEKDIDLRLFISPVHVWLLEGIRQAGLEEKFSEWKKHVVQILEEEATRAGRPPYPLWDFAYVNSISSEPVPPDGAATDATMKYYLEASHFERRVGIMILDRLFETVSMEVPEDFGIRLQPSMLERHLHETSRLHDQYTQEHPDVVREIATIWTAVQKKKAQTTPEVDVLDLTP